MEARTGACVKWRAVIGVGKELVRRVWKEADLKPHRMERYLASKDPEFEQKAAAIIGLYSESAATRGGILRGRKDGDSGAGSQGPAAAVIAGTRRKLARGSSIIAMARCHCSPHSIRRPAMSWARRRRVTPAPSS